MKEDIFQYNMRLNLNNPKHLEIFHKLNDLNLDIHKSKNNFIIDSVYKNLKSYSDEELTNTSFEEKKRGDEYVTKKELDELERRITDIFMKEVISVMLIKIGQMNTDSKMAVQNDLILEKNSENNPVDPTLKDLAHIWTNAG